MAAGSGRHHVGRLGSISDRDDRPAPVFVVAVGCVARGLLALRRRDGLVPLDATTHTRWVLPALTGAHPERYRPAGALHQRDVSGRHRNHARPARYHRRGSPLYPATCWCVDVGCGPDILLDGGIRADPWPNGAA